MKKEKETVYLGKDYVKKLDKIAVELTAELNKPVSTQAAGRYLIDNFRNNH